MNDALLMNEDLPHFLAERTKIPQIYSQAMTRDQNIIQTSEQLLSSHYRCGHTDLSSSKFQKKSSNFQQESVSEGEANFTHVKAVHVNQQIASFETDF